MGGAGPRPGGGRGWPAAMGMGRGIICMGRVPIMGPDSIMPGGIGRPGMPGPGRGMPIPAAGNQSSLRHVHKLHKCFCSILRLVPSALSSTSLYWRSSKSRASQHAGEAAGKGGDRRTILSWRGGGSTAEGLGNVASTLHPPALSTSAMLAPARPWSCPAPLWSCCTPDLRLFGFGWCCGAGWRGRLACCRGALPESCSCDREALPSC